MTPGFSRASRTEDFQLFADGVQHVVEGGAEFFQALGLESGGEGGQVEADRGGLGEKEARGGDVVGEGGGGFAVVPEGVEGFSRQGGDGSGADEGLDVAGVALLRFLRAGAGPEQRLRGGPLAGEAEEVGGVEEVVLQ